MAQTPQVNSAVDQVRVDAAMLRDVMVAMARGGVAFHDAERMFRHAYISAALLTTKGNQCAAARLVGVHRSTLARVITEMQPQRMERRKLKRGRNG